MFTKEEIAQIEEIILAIAETKKNITSIHSKAEYAERMRLPPPPARLTAVTMTSVEVILDKISQLFVQKLKEEREHQS